MRASPTSEGSRRDQVLGRRLLTRNDRVLTLKGMGHQICAIVLKGQCDPDVLAKYDLRPVKLQAGLTMCHIDHYYSACWQHKTACAGHLPLNVPKGWTFPTPDERVLLLIAQEALREDTPEFAVIATDYFGGMGAQHATVYRGDQLADPRITQISPALRHLGVAAADGKDEFDTVDLGRIRSNPEYLDKYVELADELGV